ncbi:MULTISPECIES: hypothetical protein [Snodgrassella]|uniref:hypothetical protein n=1 Tax=Snodgrassella TaxID=1193515 RepID=UPI00099828FF|nr:MULTISPECIES: hypothetical protein [Snodgrassella]NUF08021.1 hypothetical protein [Snodgrassella sp. ESL0324]OOX78509.1 hypothetical protein BGH94_07610 [Snodgrassella alvi]ORF00733.1 hypothetical protein BGH95_07970 [Snodgrassella alvi]
MNQTLRKSLKMPEKINVPYSRKTEVQFFKLSNDEIFIGYFDDLEKYLKDNDCSCLETLNPELEIECDDGTKKKLSALAIKYNGKILPRQVLYWEI